MKNNNSIQTHSNEIPIKKLSAIVSMVAFSLFLSCPMTMGQGFDLEAYLKKIDVNKNGKMEEEELGGRIKSYVVKIGLDPAKANSIKKIMSSSKKHENKSPSSRAETKKKESKVPGFGAASSEDRTPVSPFGSATESGGSNSSSKPKEKFSESANERARSTLERYDRNKNGSLDKDELKSARWGSPPPEQSDLNKDGRLSRDELAKRYQSREQYYRGSSSRSSSTSSSYSSKRLTEERAKREKERTKYRGSSSTSSRTPTYPSKSSSASSKSAPAKSKSDLASSRAKYEKYAKSLISGYDTDKDGKLSKDEFKKMRRPPVGADADKDGFVTQAELLDSLTGANKSKAEFKSSTEPKRSKSSKYERKSSRSSSSNSSFESLDSDTNKQVQMHEFSDKWDDKKVAEFYSIDKNGDGVITVKEWSQRDR